MPDFTNDPVVSVTDDTRVPAVQGKTSTINGIGVSGESSLFEGVRGVSHAGSHGGVVGVNDNDNSDPHNPAGPGVYGTSKGTGVAGHSETWIGVYGESQEAEGVRGVGHKGAGVSGNSTNWIGTYGESQEFEGVRGVSHSAAHGGVVGINDNAAGVGIYGKGGRLAGFFEGAVEVTGSLTIQGVDLLARINQLQELVANLINHIPADVNPLLRLEDAGTHILISGSGFSPLGVIKLFYGYHTPEGYSTNGADAPLIVRADINGAFFGSNFDLNGAIGMTTIGVHADDLVSGRFAEASLQHGG